MSPIMSFNASQLTIHYYKHPSVSRVSGSLTIEKHVNKPSDTGSDRYAEKKTGPEDFFKSSSPNRWPLRQFESKGQTMVIPVAKVPEQTGDNYHSSGNIEVVIPGCRIDAVA